MLTQVNIIELMNRIVKSSKSLIRVDTKLLYSKTTKIVCLIRHTEFTHVYVYELYTQVVCSLVI